MKVTPAEFGREMTNIGENSEEIRQEVEEKVANMSTEEELKLANNMESVMGDMAKTMITQNILEWLRVYAKFADEDDLADLRRVLTEHHSWIGGSDS